LTRIFQLCLKTSFLALTRSIPSGKWDGRAKKNGELMGLLVSNKFNALITIDKNLRYQQNLAKYDITICLLLAPDNKLPTLKPYIEKLENQLRRNTQLKVLEVSV